MQAEFSSQVCNSPAVVSQRSHARIQTFTQYLSIRGHTTSTARSYVRCAVHFENWLATIPPGVEVIDEAALVLFLEDHLPACSCPPPTGSLLKYQVRAALHHFLSALRKQDLIPPPRHTHPSETEEEVQDFRRYLIETCGVALETQIYRLRYVREFLTTFCGTSPVKTHSLKPHEIMSFLAERVKGCKPGTAKVIASSIRSYFKFLVLRGILDKRMLAALPTPPSWRMSTIPKALTETELEQFLSVFKVLSPIGRRNYAMALCLTDLGLRTREVALLRLEDIDWRDGTVRIVGGKNRRDRILPLTSRIGNAIADYLKTGRPKSALRTVFLRHSVLAGTPVTPHIVRAMVRMACGRIGILPPRAGPHTFRHTLASRMIQQGVSLKEIGDVLGHQSIDTTAIYTKVDLPSLLQVALPWPEVAP